MKEKLNEVQLVLDTAKQDLSDMECLKLYEIIAESLHSNIIELQEKVRARVEKIY